MSKELLWVDTKLVDKLKLVDNVSELYEEDIKGYFSDLQKEIKDFSTDIDSNVLDIQLKAQKLRESYKDTVEKEIETSRLLWEELDAKRYENFERINEAKDIIGTIEKDISGLQKKIDRINFYAIDRIIETIDKLTNMDDKQIELLKKLLEMN